MVQQVVVAASDADLDDATNQLGQRLALSPDSADESEATADLLISVLRLQCELLDDELSRRVRYLTEIRNALAGLRDLSPREMILAAPVVLSREFGFARTMISTVRRSIWLPQHLHIENEGDDPQSRRLREYLTGAQIHLANAPVEAKLIRKRCGLLVLSPKQDKRTCKEIIDVSGCSGYIAAPITIQDRAIGMLHADRPEPDGIVTMEHLDELEAFAECLAVAFEGAVLKEKAAQQHIAVGNLCAHVEELIGQSNEPAWWQLSAGTSGRRYDAYSRGDQPAVPSLTARERQIMSHVAAGATNREIGRCLVISEGTVKSHLKHVARKLNTSSRAAAVAVYAGIATAHPGESR
jgi:DNA-binding CsgD family transcriptional regulator/GAF domain-containing protein